MKHPFLSVFLISNLLCLWASCSQKSNYREITLATFSAAFLPFYPEIETRVEILKQKIKESDIDILCLQEVWFPEIQRDLYNSLKDEFPYALSVIDLTASAPTSTASYRACSGQLLLQIAVCLATNCIGVAGAGQIARCLVVSCERVLSTAPKVCLTCLLVNTGDVNCSMSLTATGLANCGMSPASQYETTFGLMLLSRIPLKNAQAQGFRPDSHVRGFLQASVEDVGDIVCTQLSANFGPFAGGPTVYPLPYETYSEQQYAELLKLFEILVPMDFPILMGDMNHSPAAPGDMTWELPLHYGLVNARGFYSPYVIKDGRCTYCVSNPATAICPANLIIDHIYIPTDTSKRVVKVERFLDSASTPSGLPLSYHYGVKMTLRDTRESCNRYGYQDFCKSHRENLKVLPPPDQHICAPLT